MKKLTEIPIPVTIALVATLITVTLLVMSGQANFASIGLLLLIGTGIGLQIHYGSVVLKRIMSVFMVVYITSFYTYFVSTLFGYVTQPFLLTLAGVTGFLATTYSKSYVYEFRSRKLWGTILAFILVIAKLTIILTGYSFWIAEIIGLNIIVIYTLLWRMWVRSYKKTKIITPHINKEDSDEKYKYIYINNRLNAENNSWLGVAFRKNRNAHPYIYSEVMKANEDNLILMLVSEANTSEVYDKGEIEINKAKQIPYIYVEAKEDTYFDEILKDIEKENVL